MKIGLVIPMQGPAGLWGPSCEASAALAAMEINRDGGILGRQIDLVAIDAGAEPAEVAETLRDAVTTGGVSAIVGMHPSDLRPVVAAAVPSDIPYVYTPLYEGGETRPHVFAIGETSEDLMAPGIEWLSDRLAASRWFLVGNDYAWPRLTHRYAASMIRSAGGQVVGEYFSRFGERDYSQVFDRIAAARPHVVVLTLLGDEAIAFNRAFGAAGLSRLYLRYCIAVDENILYAIGPENSAGMYVSSAYFSSIRSRSNDAFLERYHGTFGEYPPVQNALGQSCYEGLWFLGSLARHAATLKTAGLRAALKSGFSYRSARRPGAESGVGRLPIHLAAARGTEFQLVLTAAARGAPSIRVGAHR